MALHPGIGHETPFSDPAPRLYLRLCSRNGFGGLEIPLCGPLFGGAAQDDTLARHSLDDTLAKPSEDDPLGNSLARRSSALLQATLRMTLWRGTLAGHSFEDPLDGHSCQTVFGKPLRDVLARFTQDFTVSGDTFQLTLLPLETLRCKALLG